MKIKNIVMLGAGIIALTLLLIANPISYNTGGSRTVVQTTGGSQFVRFEPGVFWSGFFAKEYEWPNQISVTYMADQATLDLKDNGIEIGKIQIMFNDGTTADVRGIAQFVLPSDEKDMILIHNTHRTPQSLVTKRLATFTKECLQSSAQSMSSDKHYGGGRATMSQDFLDQLKNGVYLSFTEEKVVYDTAAKETKRLYITSIRKDENGQAKRKTSAIKEYQISVADASIVDTDYAQVVDDKLKLVIDAATKSAVSRQNLMTAQQEAQTAKAVGEKELVRIEYEQKQEQTKEVVQAETKVKVAEQEKLQNKVAYEATLFKVKERQAVADVSAYEKRTAIQADNALQMRTDAYVKVQSYWAEAFAKYTGNIVPQIVSGTNSSSSNGMLGFMETIGAKSALDLSYQLRPNNNLGPVK